MTQLTMGPVLFNWAPAQWRDFYCRIADEAPVDTVYVGEVICAKRAPFLERLYGEVTERLEAAGKTVVLATLAEVMNQHERSTAAGICAQADRLVEVNDAAALSRMQGRPHAVGPFVNTYNEAGLRVLARFGARHVTLPAELSGDNLRAMAAAARDLGVTLETQVYGRIPLALSARCYHARAHGRTKDSCQYVCQNDSDGMPLTTLEGEPFLTVNGIQTLSHACLNLMNELPALQAMGIDAVRLSPHTHDMVATARLFRDVLDGAVDPADAMPSLPRIAPTVPFCNGFYYAAPGHQWMQPSAG
jgi:collagenase-like PrtC family protease